ncbi:alanine racemase [Patescibacteria group bacterium]
MDKSVRSWVEVSRSALRHNAKTLKSCLAPGTSFMPVVKSNAYGHGIRETVRSVGALADWFGVDSLPEAEKVRAAGSRKPVLVMGYTRTAALGRLVRAGFRQVVYSRESVEELSRKASVRRPAKVHVKVETGTSRQGLPADELPAFLRYAAKLPNLQVEGLLTHYANIEDTNNLRYAEGQLKRFREALRAAAAAGAEPKLMHASCSAAVLTYPDTHFNLARAGCSLYGYWPSEVTRRTALEGGRRLELMPALTWKAVVAQVKRIPKGAPVSYGLTERVMRDTRVAVVTVGYWDGFDRKQSSVGNVLIRGRRAKVLGRVCMNMCLVDVTDIRGVRAEDEVVLLGKQGRERISVEEFADRIGTINYEVVTRINPLAPRALVP